MSQIPARLSNTLGKLPGPVGRPLQNAKSLDSTVAVVTGGAAGIGRSVAALLAAKGATVVIGDINADAAAVTAQEIGAAAGWRLDVADRPG